MIESSSFVGFVIAALIVLVVPGPGVLYVIARTLSQGQRAGLVSTFGLAIGALVHVAAATIGLFAILLASSTAFGIVKFLGAAYLVYLGIRTLMSRRSIDQTGSLPPRSLYYLFIDSIVISVFNPKVAIFFLAFFPQFVDPTLGPAPQQILFLGIV